MGLNNINSKSTWGQAASDINTNFTTIDSELKKVKNATTRNKGYFSSIDELKAAFSTANVGDIAYVGSAYPYAIWKWNGSAWANSGSTGGEESVNLGDYYTKVETDEKFTETDEKLSELGSYKSYNYTKDDYTNSLVREIHIEGVKNESLRYFVRSCKRYRGIDPNKNMYFAIQSFNPLDGSRSTICEFQGINESGVYSQTMNGYTTTILVTIENQNDGGFEGVDYSEKWEINENCWGEKLPIIISLLKSTERDTKVKKGSNNIVSSDSIYRAITETREGFIRAKLYIISNFNEEPFSQVVLRIPYEERQTPAIVICREGASYYQDVYIYRGDNADSDKSDEFWGDLNYWTKFEGVDKYLSKFAEIDSKSYNYTKNDYVNSLIKEIHIEGERDESLIYFVRSCTRVYSATPGYAYFAIQSYNQETGERKTVCEFLGVIDKSGLYEQTLNGYKTTIYVTLENQKEDSVGFAAEDYSEDKQINDICWGSRENVPLINAAIELTELKGMMGYKNNHVDLIMFMGQSNMAGRGTASQAPKVLDGIAYEFRAISDNTKLYPILEPFGVNENKEGGINEPGEKTGSLVSSFVNSYTKTTGKIVVGVSASKGGTNISQWQNDGILLPDAVQRFRDAVSYLETNGYTIDKKYMVWLQGESDGDRNLSFEEYKSLFLSMFEVMKSEGVEICHLIRIGQLNTSDSNKYSNIISAQTELCKEHHDVVMASTALTSFREKGLMKDQFHYSQHGYNLVGKYAGRNAGLYRMYGMEKPQYDSMTGEMYFSDMCY